VPFRFDAERGSESLMSDEAKDLRDLAAKIAEVVREHRANTIAWEQTRALCDYLTLRARVIELGDELRRRDRDFGKGTDRMKTRVHVVRYKIDEFTRAPWFGAGRRCNVARVGGGSIVTPRIFATMFSILICR
jgi:hypothetical protein